MQRSFFSSPVIVDGPDGAGKTTFCEQLIDNRVFLQNKEQTCPIPFGFTRIHSTYRFKKSIPYYHAAQFRKAASYGLGRDKNHRGMAKFYGKHISGAIMDRWFLSELAYGIVFRGKTNNPISNRFMHRAMLCQDSPLIVCMHESIKDCIAEHEENKKARDEMYDEISDIWRFYADILTGTTSCKIKGNKDEYSTHLMKHGGLAKLDPNNVRYLPFKEITSRSSFISWFNRNLRYTDKALKMKNVCAVVLEPRKTEVDHILPHCPRDFNDRLTNLIHAKGLPESYFHWTYSFINSDLYHGSLKADIDLLIVNDTEENYRYSKKHEEAKFSEVLYVGDSSDEQINKILDTIMTRLYTKSL